MKCIETCRTILLIAIIGYCAQDYADISSLSTKKPTKSYIIAIADLETPEDTQTVYFVDQQIDLDLTVYTKINALKKAIINNPNQYIFTDKRNNAISSITTIEELKSVLEHESLALYTKEAAEVAQNI